MGASVLILAVCVMWTPPRSASLLRKLAPCFWTHPCTSQRSLHNAPIFRLLLKVAVKGTHQCDFANFCGASCPNSSFGLHAAFQSQVLGISRCQGLKARRSMGLRVSRPRGLKVSRPQGLKASRSRGLGTEALEFSGSRGLRVSRSQCSQGLGA